jgi:outer membrane protein assembly factor BamE
MRIVIISIALALLVGCGSFGFPGVYRINVEQGNLVDQEMVDQLKPGMSRRQVRYIMGTPLVEDSFNLDRWDYAHSIRNGKQIITQSILTVYFDGDELIRIEGDLAPSDPTSEPESAAL